MSLSTKNLFSLIPDPARCGKWHGEGDKFLPQSIIDINKIYRGLFKTLWINKIKESSLLIDGRNSVEVDTITAHLMGVDPQKIPYLTLTATTFGGYDRTVLARAASLLNKM